MKNLIMISSTSHSKNNMGDEFYSILKLVSGEEIFAMVCVDESDDEPILILHNPIKMKPLNQMSQLSYIKVTPWMEMTDEDMFVMKMDKVITMTECKDQKLIKIYKQYIEEKDSDDIEVIQSRSKKGKVKLSGDPRLGYISSVEKKRQSLEEKDNPILSLIQRRISGLIPFKPHKGYCTHIMRFVKYVKFVTPSPLETEIIVTLSLNLSNKINML